MRFVETFLRDRSASAAAELALVFPMLLALTFGSVELGNYFLVQHALEKQVRDGARYASRLELADDYSCPDTVYEDADATTKIVNVTQNGAVSGSGNPRWGSYYWSRTCDGEDETVSVTIRCVDKNDIDTEDTGKSGMYTTLAGDDIPVVEVSAAVQYQSVLASFGFNATNICARAETEAAVTGL